MSSVLSGEVEGYLSPWSGSGSNKFSDPFILPSSDYMPATLESAFDFCVFLSAMNPQYRKATDRVVAHFITELDFEGDDGDKEERDAFRDYLVQRLDLFGSMGELGEEWGTYGNGFGRIHFPFDRTLIDLRSGKLREWSLDIFGEDIHYNYHDLTYTVPDPALIGEKGINGSPKVTLPFRDRRSSDIDRIKLKKIDPRRVDLRTSHISGKMQVVWRFEEWFIRDIKAGRAFQANETPISMLKAIRDNQDYLFQEDEVFHLRSPTISGVSNNGWGIPEILLNYRSLHQLQVYRKIDEAIGLDYMLPFRIITPAMGKDANGGDMTQSLLMTDFTANISEMIARRRKDPFAMHSLPWPVNYQEFSGEGKQLTPKDLIQFQTNDMLDGMGYPAELFRGTLAMQTIPTTLRLFENTFHFLYRGFNNYAKWVIRRVRSYANQAPLQASLQLPSIADDLEERQVYLQLAASGEVSRGKAYRVWGIDDPVREAKERMQEDIAIQKEQMKLQQQWQKEQQSGSLDAIMGQQQGSGGSSAGGAAGSAPQGTEMTPLDMDNKASQTAQEWLGIQDNGTRSKAMNQVKGSNPQLSSLAKQKMEDMRSQGASQGRKSVGQQAGSPGGQAQQ